MSTHSLKAQPQSLQPDTTDRHMKCDYNRRGVILSAAKDLCISQAAAHHLAITSQLALKKKVVIPSAARDLLFACIATIILVLPNCARAQGLSSTLTRTTAQVTDFLDQVSNVRCAEHVSQIKFNAKNTRPEIQQVSNYDYLILLQGTGDDLLLNESRLEDKNDTAPKRNLPLLITNGFSTLFLIFHPYYRNGFRFEALPDDLIDGERFTRLRFTHIPGTRTPAALAVRGREYPLELTGTAWIEPATGMIARIETSLANDMHDVGLRSITAQIDYTPVQLPGWTHAYRFPSVATVEVESLRQHWRNVHRFTNYQRFMVDTQSTVANDPTGSDVKVRGESITKGKKKGNKKDSGAPSLRSKGGSVSDTTTNSDQTNQ